MTTNYYNDDDDDDDDNDNNNNNNNNTLGNVYGAVVMTSHFESSHGSSDECKAAADAQTKPTYLGCESACGLLLSTTAIAIYSARKLIFILPSHGG